jgi:hypothetical protein
MVIFQQREKEIFQLQQTRVQKQFQMFFYVPNINQNLLGSANRKMIQSDI